MLENYTKVLRHLQDDRMPCPWCHGLGDLDKPDGEKITREQKHIAEIVSFVRYIAGTYVTDYKYLESKTLEAILWNARRLIEEYDSETKE